MYSVYSRRVFFTPLSPPIGCSTSSQSSLYVFLTYVNIFPPTGCVCTWCMCVYVLCVHIYPESPAVTETRTSWKCFPSKQFIQLSPNVAPISGPGLCLQNIFISELTLPNCVSGNGTPLQMLSQISRPSPSLSPLPRTTFSFFMPSKDLVCSYPVDSFRSSIPFYGTGSTSASALGSGSLRTRRVCNIYAFPAWLAESLACELLVHRMVCKFGLTEKH